MGDFNVKIGMKIDEASVGLHGIGRRNDRGQMLVNYLEANKFYAMNIFFFNKKRHRKWTWICPDGKTKNEIDFICADYKNVTVER